MTSRRSGSEIRGLSTLTCVPTVAPTFPSTYGLRRHHLSSREERWCRKTRQGDCGPLSSPGVMLTPTGRALCIPLRDDVSTRLSRLRCREANALGVRCGGKSSSFATTRLQSSNHVGYSLSANVFAALGAVSTSPWKQCACHTPQTGLIASIAQRRAPKGVGCECREQRTENRE